MQKLMWIKQKPMQRLNNRLINRKNESDRDFQDVSLFTLIFLT